MSPRRQSLLSRLTVQSSFPGHPGHRLRLVPAAGAGVKGQDHRLANAGADTVNSIKQASEFGIVRGGQKLAALLAFITDVHALGLQTSQGLIMTEASYWDLNDANRRALVRVFKIRVA